MLCMFHWDVVVLTVLVGKNKVNLIVNETIKLPNGFIVGVSFMSGSLLGSFLNINEFFKKEKN